MDEHVEKKQREYVKPIDEAVHTRWNAIIQRDKQIIRHLSVLKRLPGLNGLTVNNAVNHHIATDTVKNLIEDYFNRVELKSAV